jgi:transketolase
MAATIDKPFANTLLKAAEMNKNLVVVDADLSRVCETNLFAEKYPERYFNIGVAEANMVSISSGLALSGKTVFCGTFAGFISLRAGDQVSVGVAYMETDVKLCGFEAALVSGANGATHECMQDLAIMRSMPNMRVYDPVDATDLSAIIEYEATHPGPAYLRGIRKTVPVILDPQKYHFQPGKAFQVREGKDVTLIASGMMLARAISAAELLAAEKISARVLSMSCLKPIDSQSILLAAAETGCIVTAENHSILGGLGSAVAEVVTENHPVPVLRIGIQDKFGEVGKDDYLAEKFEIGVPDIIKAARNAIALKNKKF